MFWPIAACVLLPWLLVYLGLHVVQRGIIFIDIAMAQMASLGICVAVLLQFEPESLMASVMGLAVTRDWRGNFFRLSKRASQVPQEAIIGIAYVVAAAAAILLLSRSPHGNEEIRNMLVGDITVVSAPRFGNVLPSLRLWARCILFCERGSCSSPFNATWLMNVGGACAGGIFFSTPPSASS